MTFCIDYVNWPLTFCIDYVISLNKSTFYDYIDPIYIVELEFICSTAAPTYGVYISQLVRYSTNCVSDQDFLGRGLLLTTKLLSKLFLELKLKSSLRKFNRRHHDSWLIVTRYVSQMTMDIIFLFLCPRVMVSHRMQLITGL